MFLSDTCNCDEIVIVVCAPCRQRRWACGGWCTAQENRQHEDRQKGQSILKDITVQAEIWPDTRLLSVECVACYSFARMRLQIILAVVASTTRFLILSPTKITLIKPHLFCSKIFRINERYSQKFTSSCLKSLVSVLCFLFFFRFINKLF